MKIRIRLTWELSRLIFSKFHLCHRCSKSNINSNTSRAPSRLIKNLRPTSTEGKTVFEPLWHGNRFSAYLLFTEFQAHNFFLRILSRELHEEFFFSFLLKFCTPPTSIINNFFFLLSEIRCVREAINISHWCFAIHLQFFRLLIISCFIFKRINLTWKKNLWKKILRSFVSSAIKLLNASIRLQNYFCLFFLLSDFIMSFRA